MTAPELGSVEAAELYANAPDDTALDRARKVMLKLHTFALPAIRTQQTPGLVMIAAAEAQIAQAEALQAIAHELIIINDREAQK